MENQITRLSISNEDNPEDSSSPEVELLEQFAKYLDFKRNDILRAASRASSRASRKKSPQTMNIEVENNLS